MGKKNRRGRHESENRGRNLFPLEGLDYQSFFFFSIFLIFECLIEISFSSSQPSGQDGQVRLKDWSLCFLTLGGPKSSERGDALIFVPGRGYVILRPNNTCIKKYFQR